MFEAWFLGKPTIEIRYNKKDLLTDKKYASGCNVVTNLDQTVQWINHYLSGKPISDEILKRREEQIAKWCYKADGHSTARCAEVIHQFLERKKTTPKRKYSFLALKKLFYQEMKQVKKGLEENILFTKKNEQDDKLNFMGVFDKYITNEDVIFWNNRLRRLF
jgi:hypothetical protein